MHGALQLIRLIAPKPTGRLPFLAKSQAREEARLEKQRRERLISAAVQILDKGEPTRFAFEGAVRHGLRSGICLEGAGWHEADALAAAIVKEAFRRMGVSRPTWEQAQPESAQFGVARVEHYFCVKCGRPIEHDDDRIIGKKYCSKTCQQAGLHRPRDQRVSRAEYLAACAAKTTIECDHCGTPFRHGGKLSRRFCSEACSHKGLVKERPTLTCEWCSKRFQLRFPSDERRFCSNACAVSSRHAANRAAKPKRHCKQCGGEMTRIDQKTFCSRECANEFRFHRSNGFACEAVATDG